MVFFPPSLDAVGRLVEGDQHVPVAAAGRVPGPQLHEDLHGALGDVQVAGAQIRPLVHGGGRVYEEEEDRHGPGGAPARRAPCGEEGAARSPGRPPLRSAPLGSAALRPALPFPARPCAARLGPAAAAAARY